MTDLGHHEEQSSKPKKSAPRQSRSCRVCRLRKVKCDRVKPCHACCAYGHPAKCVYDVGPDDDDSQSIAQAEEIRNLRNQIKELKTRIGQQGGGQEARSRKLAELERLFNAIRSEPIDVVDDLVGSIRADRQIRRLQAGGQHADNLPLRMLTPFSTGQREDEEEQESTLEEWHLMKFGQSTGQRSDSQSSSSGSSSTESIAIDEDWAGPLSRFTPQKPMLDIFLQRFVDAFSPEVDASSGHAGALRAGAEIRIFSPLISRAYDAVSLTFFGRAVKDTRIEAAGLNLYPKVLRSLQEALQDPERSRSESTLITVTLLLAFESIERTTDAGVLAHVRGAARLIEHRGPENHVQGVEHLLFTELRPYWVGVSLVDRKPSFMNTDAWKNVPWSLGTTTKDLLHYLIDLVVEIPALLGEHDDLNASRGSQMLGKGELRSKQARLWNAVGDLTERFTYWKKKYVDEYPRGTVKEEEIPKDPNNPFPIFRCRDLRTMKIIEPPSLIYPDLRLLQTMCFYYATRLILSTIDDRPEGAVSMPEKYYLACSIARSLQDYLARAPGNMINRLAFPTRVAWEAFPPSGPEREFMTQVFNLVEARHSLRLWGSSMPELSAQRS